MADEWVGVVLVMEWTALLLVVAVLAVMAW